MNRPAPAIRQGGVSLVAAIFLLLLMAALAALMVNLISVTQVNQAADIGGSRAYQAARAGVEWGLYQLDPNGQTLALPDCTGANGTITAIPGYSVAVSCTMYPGSGNYTEGGRNIRIFRLVATATDLGAKPPGIERRVQVTVEKCRDSALTGSDPAPYDC